MPRLENGQPDLQAPAPRTADGKPDISGHWRFPLHPGYVGNIAADLDPSKIQPWARSVFMERMSALGAEDPWTIGCQPAGPRAITHTGRFKILQSESEIVFLFQDLTYRQIFIDGRELPENPFANFMGYSVGHWVGDELVVDTVGFDERSWLDFGGHPHTEDLRVTERFRRDDFGHLQRQITLTDPGTFDEPITLDSTGVFSADTELLETVCTDTPPELRIPLGATRDERNVTVAPELLARYVGTYVLDEPASFGILEFRVHRAGDQLLIDFNGKGRLPLIPLSDTTFSPRILGTFEFVTDGRGVATELLAHAVEGTFRARRRPDVNGG